MYVYIIHIKSILPKECCSAYARFTPLCVYNLVLNMLHNIKLLSIDHVYGFVLILAL